MKNTGIGSTFFRKKGFFVALYSCLGVVAVLALVVTIANRPQDIPQEFSYEYEDSMPVGADQVETYRAGMDEEAWFRPRQQQVEPNPPATPPTPPPDMRPPAEPPRPPMTVPPQEEMQPPEPPPEPEPTPEPTPEPEAYTPPPPVTMQVATFTPFSDGDLMSWPLYGETVMPFSLTAAIYDPNLDQFRTNDNLRIAAVEGEPVRAGAYGKVIAIGRNVRQGNYVTVDHGNGWVATYGQLMSEILVSEGDVVSGGQILGGVGQPSIFGSAHGTHLHLRIERDNAPINPYYVLAARTDC